MKFKKFALSICFIFLISIFLPSKHVQASSATSQFVTNLFVNIQGRSPDAGGLTYWTNRLTSNTITGSDTVKLFILSPEFTQKSLTNEQYINVLYKSIHNRLPGPTEKLYWIGLLNSYYSRLYVLAGITSSPEFATTCKNYGISQGQIILTNPIDIYPNETSFVSKAFNSILNRDVDASGLSFFVNLLGTKKITAAQIIDTLTYSDEFTKSQVSSEEYITRLFKGVLSRTPNKDGFDYWLNVLMNGYSRRYVLYGFINSPEFTYLCNKSNITPGTLSLSSLDLPYNGVIVGYTNTLLSLRSGPSTQSTKIDSIPNGSKVIIENRFFDSVSGSEFYQIKWIKNTSTGPVLLEGYSSATYIYVVTDTVNNSMLGALSGQYESNGNPGSVSSGTGDYGGVSYGVWQFSLNQKSLTSFVLWLYSEKPTFFTLLDNARKSDGNTYGINFKATWKTLGKDNYHEFYDLQHKYTKISYYDNLVNSLMSTGNYETRLKSFAVRNALWSTAVQHGVSGSTNIVSKFKNVTDISQFINCIYTERSKVNIYFPSSPTLHASLINRFIREKSDALKIYNYELQ